MGKENPMTRPRRNIQEVAGEPEKCTVLEVKEGWSVKSLGVVSGVKFQGHPAVLQQHFFLVVVAVC